MKNVWNLNLNRRKLSLADTPGGKTCLCIDGHGIYIETTACSLNKSKLCCDFKIPLKLFRHRYHTEDLLEKRNYVLWIFGGSGGFVIFKSLGRTSGGNERFSGELNFAEWTAARSRKSAFSDLQSLVSGLMNNQLLMDERNIYLRYLWKLFNSWLQQT